MSEPIYQSDDYREVEIPALCTEEDNAKRAEIEVLGVAAVVLAALTLFAGWQFLKELFGYLERQWSWYALSFDMPLDISGFMDLAFIGLAACMLAAGQPYFARLMRRPWAGWSETAMGVYWLGSAVCAWCFMSASNAGLPLEIASHLGFPMGDWGVAVQLSYIVLSIVVYVLIAALTKNNPGPLAALGLCLSSVVAALSGFILVAIGVAYLATIAFKKIGAALDAEDEKESEWTDEDDELLEDLCLKWHRTRGKHENKWDDDPEDRDTNSSSVQHDGDVIFDGSIFEAATKAHADKDDDADAKDDADNDESIRSSVSNVDDSEREHRAESGDETQPKNAGPTCA